MTVLLEVENINKHFGGLQVVHQLSFKLHEAEILSVIGPNGAGKTSVLNLLTGVNAPDRGDIRFQGQSIIRLTPHQITRLGIARTFQTLRLFLNMSIIENVMAAAYTHTRANLLEIIFRLPRWREEERQIRVL